jgi:hypothetical protein
VKTDENRYLEMKTGTIKHKKEPQKENRSQKIKIRTYNENRKQEP